jgi:Calx-beta domain-containing protein/cadherin-like protein/Big-like domain-containing protein/uncharacterized protein DUF4214
MKSPSINPRLCALFVASIAFVAALLLIGAGVSASKKSETANAKSAGAAVPGNDGSLGTAFATPTPTPDFSITGSPVAIQKGLSTTTVIFTTVTSGAAEAINLLVSGAPAGVTTSFNPTPVTAGNMAGLMINVSSSVAVGTYPLTVTGQAPSATHSTSVNLIVTSAPPLTNQIYFRINNGQFGEIQLGDINLDGTARHTIYFGGGNTSLPADITGAGNETTIAVDTAAGFVFSVGIGRSTDVTDPIENSYDAFSVHNLNTGALIETIEFGPNTGAAATDDVVQAVTIDPTTHTVYVGDWGTDLAHTGVAVFSYNTSTGIVTPSSSGTGTTQITTTIGGVSTISNPSGLYLFTESQVPGYTNANAFFLDKQNNKLYYTNDDSGYNISPYSPTNAVYVVNTVGPSFTATQLSSLVQFPTANQSLTGHDQFIGPNGSIVGTTVDVADGIVFFETTDNTFSSNNALWWLNANGGANQTATKVNLPSGLTLKFAGQSSEGGLAAGLSFDQSLKQIYLTDAENSNTFQNTGRVYVLQWNNASKTVSLVTTYDTATLTGVSSSTIAAESGSSATAIDILPTLTTSGTSTHASEQGANLTLLTAVPAITDADGNHLASATVQITGGTFSSNETSANDDHLTIDPAHRALGGTNTSGTVSGTSISYTYTSGTELLTLSGYDTLTNYQTALSFVQYFTTGDNPANYGGNTTRTITWQVNDGAIGNPVAANRTTTTLTIDAQNDAPNEFVGGADSASIAVNETNSGINQTRSLSIADPDSLTETLTLTNFSHTGPTGGISDTTLQSFFSIPSSASITQSTGIAGFNWTFNSGSEAFNFLGAGQTLTINYTIHDVDTNNSNGPGSIVQSDDQAISVVITGVNDAPVVTAGNTLAYTENDPATTISPAATLSDVDSADFNGGSLTVSFGATGHAEDQLTIQNQGPGLGQIGTSGSNVTFSGATIGTFAGGSNGANLVITFTTASATQAAAQSLLEHIQYSNNSDNPATTARTVTYTLNDGDGTANGGTNTGSAAATINITAVNDPPVAGAAGNTVSYTEQHTAVNIDSGLTVTDPDNVNLAGATVQVTSGGFTGDVLAVNGVSNGTITIGSNTVTISYDAATEKITLTGSDTLAHYQTLLEETSFRSSSDNPDNNGANPSRTITWILNDGSASNNLSTAVTSTVNIIAVNDPPVLSNVAATANYTENAAPVTLSSGVTISDVDGGSGSNSPLLAAAVKINTGFVTGDRLLVFDTSTSTSNTSGIYTGLNIQYSYDSSTHILALTGNDTITNYQHVLQNVQFDSTSDDPDNAGTTQTRTITWQVQDAGGTTNGGNDLSTIGASTTTTLTIHAVNDTPTITAPASYTGSVSTPITMNGITVGDVDAGTGTELLTLSVASGTFTASSSGGVTIGGGGTGTLTATGTIANLNTYITANNISFTGTQSATLNLNINDQGHTPAPAQSAGTTAQILVCSASVVVANTNDSSAGSLRQALLDVCDGGTITFDTAAGHAFDPATAPHTITLATGELAINKSLAITAPGANQLTISGNNASRVFTVGSGLTVSISGLTVSGGNGLGTMSGFGGGVLNLGGTLAVNNSAISDNSIAGSGGGIFNNAGVMTITNSTISGNTTTGGSGGGGIFNQTGAAVTVSNCTISGNNTTGNGGAIYNNAGTVNVTDSTLSTNSANNTGGGILNQSGSTLNITNSTLSGNTAGSGGGLYHGGGSTVIVNSTVSGNTATGSGGGLETITTGVTLTNVTVTNNHSDNDNNGAEIGGGIYVGSGTISLLNTIVAGNFIGSTASVADDINGAGGASATGSFNLIGTGGSGGLTNGTNNNQVGVADAKLGGLANNGGPTQTHALLVNSTAIEAGTDVTTLNGAIDNSTTTVVVTDGASIPAGAGFLVQIDSEQMSVTSKSTNTLTVVRGANGTAPAIHNDGAAVNPAFDQRGSGFPRKADSADANTTQTVDIGAYELHPTVEDIPDKSTAEDTPSNFNFNIGDGTGALITSVTATSNNAALIPNANLSVTGSGATRNLAITPVTNANSATNGTATITVTVTATNSQTATDTFVVTVTDVNDAPNVTGETIGNIAEDCGSGCTAGKYVIPFATLLANDNAGPADENGQTITITNVGSAVGGSVAINGTDVEFTPAADFNGAASFQYTVTDNGTSNGLPDPKSAVGTASFTITEVNDPPVATDDSLAGVSEDCASGCSAGKYVIPFAILTGNDSQGPANESTQTLTITLVNNAVGGTVAINGTNVEFTPTANFNGPASFDYTVQDNGTTNGVNDFKTAVGHVSFPVAPIADTPAATPNPASTNEDTQTSGIVLDRNAADGNEVAFFQILNITNGSLFQNDGTTPITNNSFITYAQGNAGLKFTPSANFFGISSFQVKGSIDGSGTGLSSALTVTINVSAVADVPAITPATTNEDTQSTSGLVITRNAADGAEVTNFKITNIQNGTLFLNDGTTPINNDDFITIAQGGAGLKFTPSPNLYSPVSTFSFDAAGATSAGGAGLGSSATASITVNAVADTPSVTPNPQTTAISTQTGPMVINRNAADGAEVTNFKITNITNGVLYQNDGTTPINNNDFITFAQGNGGLKFTPTAGLSSPANNFGFDVQASLNNTNGGLGGGIVHEDIIVSCSDPQVVTSILDDGSAGTLRYAISNSCPGTGTITFNLPAGPQTITLGSELTIAKTLSIIGPSNQAVTINGNGNRVLTVTGGSPTISSLSFTGALVSGGNGGGLLNTGAGTITFNGVTFSGNSADNGGAIATTAGTIVVNNSTISGNTATTDGGGIYVNGGTVTLLNDTITNNTATVGQGGGLNRVAGTVNVKNTIIAGNTATSNGDVAGTINDQGNNILSGNPQLAPLANNGGPTMTHALLANSPALDAGDNVAAAAFVTDQRGNTFGRFRDAANDADTTQTVDIGSFEADPSIEDISDKSTNEDVPLPTFSFRVADTFSAFDSITATSSNQTLVPDANILISGSGNSRNMDITPAANQFGTATITVTATKTINSTLVSMSDTFMLTVNSVGDTPNVTNAATNEDTQTTSGLVITRNAADGAEIQNFKITNITGGTLFKNNGVTMINNNDFITVAEGGAGLKFTPAPNSIANGGFQVQSSQDNIGTGLSTGVATATITVTAIADTPSVTNATTNEDVQSASGLVITRNAADGAEVTHFKITNIQNGALFLSDGVTPVSSGSFITFAQGNAGLRFTPATNLNSPGTTFSFNVQASTSNSNAGLGGGVVTATISVAALNDAPSFTKGPNQAVNENAGAQTVNNWATNLSAGPADESGQTLNFIVSNDNNALFSAQPALSAAGVLAYTPAVNASGSATVSVSLHDNGGTTNGGADTSAVQTFTITVNSGGTLQFSAATYTVAENAGPAVITINRVGGSAATATVQIATSNGTATAGSDYTAVSQTVTFNDGETSKTVNVPITDDLLNEPDETVNLTLSNAGGSATLGSPATAVLTITNDDPAGGYIKFSAPNYNVNEGGVATITAQRVGTLTQAVTVDYATTDNSDPAAQQPCGPTPGNTLASSRCDFTSAFGRLTWAAGDGTDKTFRVMTTQDYYVEGPETLTLTLSNLTGGAGFSGPSTALLTINDDAVEPPGNPVDDSNAFVEQLYRDFLNRPSDPSGKAFWVNNIDHCNDPAQRPPGQTAAQCIEISRTVTAGAFFLSIEFQTTGGAAYLTNKVSFGSRPNFVRFERDAQQIGQGYVFGAPGAETVLETNKVAYFNDYVTRPEFVATYGGVSNQQYVNTLISNTGVTFTQTEKDALINGLANHTETRATVLRKISEKPEFRAAETNSMFVLMEYYGFLRRNPDQAGFDFWLNKLNSFNGDYFAAEMVKAFLNSNEYRGRFGP